MEIGGNSSPWIQGLEAPVIVILPAGAKYHPPHLDFFRTRTPMIIITKVNLLWSVEQKKIMDHFDNFFIQIPVKSGHHAAPFHQLVLADYSLNHWNNRTSKIGYLLLQGKSYFFSKEDLRQWYFLPKRRFIASEEANIFHFQKKIPWFFFTKGDTWMVILQLSGY